MSDTQYKEYIGQIPYNTYKVWGSELMKNIAWEYVGWSGEAREPYRHWAAYPHIRDEIRTIWDTMNFFFKEDGYYLKPERAIANLFSHGDSSWLHRDCESNTAWTAIIYLNELWDLNWGGETILAKDNEIMKAFAPTPGKFILFKSNILHGPRPVSREAPFPRFGLAFQCEADNDSYLQGLSETKISPVSVAKL